MRKMIKGLLVVVCAGFLWMASGSDVMVAQAKECAQSEVTITPRADIIEWRYKIVNGSLYQRQYNCSKEVWIGEWELC